MNKKQQSGFTLIELIMVIVVLGILSAVALPKFSDMNVDARKATLISTKGALESAIAMVHSQALVKSQVGEGGVGPAQQKVVLEDGTIVDLKWGYPTQTSLLELIKLTGFDTTTTATDGKLSVLGVVTAANCQMVYINDMTEINGKPSLELVATTGVITGTGVPAWTADACK